MASGVGIVKAQPQICSWHLTPSPAGNARRSVPRSLSPHCPRRGAGVNGASRLLAGYRSRRSSGNRSPLRRAGPRSRAGAGVRIAALHRELPANWDNVSVTAWAGLTVEFCRQHGADVIIRGVRNRSDLPHEYQLAAMNESLGIATLLLPADPRLAAVSSTILRGLSI